MPPGILKHRLINAACEGCLILLVSVITAMGVNLIRTDPIPFAQDWSVQGRLSLDNGDSLEIALSDAKLFFNANTAVFLDARDKDLFDQGHIKGAKNLPWHEVDEHFLDITRGMDRETPIITYCDGESCNLSHDLALFLKSMGFTRVKVLVNGWTVWQENQLPMQNSL